MILVTSYLSNIISSLPNVVKSLKGTAAREWFKQYPDTKQLLWNGHLWSGSFFASTIGNVSQNIVNEYIKSQMKTVILILGMLN